MKAKFVYEALNEVSHKEDQWADTQIDRWEMEKKGINPLRKYVQDIAKMILDYTDEEIIKTTGITDYIIEDLITDDNLFKRNAYTFYNEGVPVAAAAYELGMEVENYMMEQL